MKTIRPLIVAAALAACLLCGCAPIAEAQGNLAAQARTGLDLLRAAHNERRSALDAARASQRKALDAAFDQDVRACARAAGNSEGPATRPAFDADWVIAARKAYAIGLDALASQRTAAQQADAAAEANYQALEQALDEIRLLSQTQLTWANRVTSAIKTR